MPRFFVSASDIADGSASVGGTEFRHLQRVLRLREGDHVTLFDDAGKEHAGVIVSLSPRVAVVRVTASTMPRRESPLAVTLYQGIPKGRKMDLVVEKATELGVHAIFFEGSGTVPFVALDEPAAPPRTAAIAIGPEGGFSRDETAAARGAGFMLVDMGPRILRTETAALVAITLVQARWGDLGARDARSE